MQIYTSLNITPYHLEQTGVITIGTYDSIHLGHQSVIKETVRKAKEQNALSVVVTYLNHPISVLKPQIKVCNLLTVEHKLKLLEDLGVDIVFLLTFTKEFSEMTAEQFIDQLNQAIKIESLVLGYDSAIGKDRQGNKEALQKIAIEKGFGLEYMPEVVVDGVLISTSKIRQLLFSGDFTSIAKLLGRPYSLYVKASKDDVIDLEGLCLLPKSEYNLKIRYGTDEGSKEIDVRGVIGVNSLKLLLSKGIRFSSDKFIEIIFA